MRPVPEHQRSYRAVAIIILLILLVAPLQSVLANRGGSLARVPGRVADAVLPAALQAQDPTATESVPAASSSPDFAQNVLTQLPVSFVPNRGQIKDGDIKFQTSQRGGAVFSRPGEIQVVVPHNASKRVETSEEEALHTRATKPPFELRVRYQGANESAVVRGRELLPGKANFLLGSDPSRWVQDIETYDGVVYEAFYPGIDLVLEGQEGQIKSTFVVSPNGNPADIRWIYQGAEEVTIDETGNARIQVKHSEEGLTFLESAPVAWQEIDGQTVSVPVRFVLHNDRKLSFELPEGYDPNNPLIIDPTLQWGTYLGGNWWVDEGRDVALDSSGNVIITGYSGTCDYYPLVGAMQGPSGAEDIILSKLDPTGSTLLYSTCFGGSLRDYADGLAIDAADNMILTGWTNSTNFPTTASGYSPTINVGTCGSYNCWDAFVAKINPAGNQVVYGTYLGGTNEEMGNAVAVDADGMIYVAGHSYSTNYPVTANAFDTTNNGGKDAVLTKLDPTASGAGSLVYSSYFGGWATEVFYDLSLDATNNVYLVGATSTNSGFPLVNPIQSTRVGSSDVFVARMDLTQSGAGALLFSTYWGGAAMDQGYGIAAVDAGFVYVAGYTESTNFPVHNALQPSQGGDCASGCRDAFVAKIDTVNAQIVYSTYLGGSAFEEAYDIAVDNGGRAFVVGYTKSTNFPILDPLQERGANGCSAPPCADAFTTALDPSGASLAFSTYLGGSLDDVARAVTIDAGGDVFVCGMTYSIDFPITDGAYDPNNPYVDRSDVFVVKYTGFASGPTLSWSAEGDVPHAWFGFSVSGAGDINGDSYDDVVVGAPHYSNGQADEGAVYLYYGSSEGLGDTPLTIESNVKDALFGWSVGSAGDVNDDGFGDVIVGATGCSSPEAREGCAFVYLGTANGLATTPAWTVQGDQSHAGFGYVVGALGDINGDSKSDVFVGAPSYDSGEVDEGKVFVYLSLPDGLNQVAGWTAEGNQANAYFGMAVASAGDVSGDGKSDLIVGAPNASNTQVGEGKAYVFFSANDTLMATPVWIANGGQAQAHFGEAVSAAGDINGDGRGDVLIGAPDYDLGETDEGAVFVFFSSATGLNLSPDWTSQGDQDNANFGLTIVFVASLDNNGTGALLVGASRSTNVEANEGNVSLYYVIGNEIDGTTDWMQEGGQPFANYGYSVGSAGDVNGDGWKEFLIGANQMDFGQIDEGRVLQYSFP